MRGCALAVLGLCLLSPCLAANQTDAKACAEALSNIIDNECGDSYNTADGSCTSGCKKAIAGVSIDAACYNTSSSGEYQTAIDL